MANTLQSEASETHALQSWHGAAISAVPDFDWRLERIGDAICSVSSAESSILFNRVLGLGPDATLEQLARIRQLYDTAGISPFFLHVVPERKTTTTEQRLELAGYEKYRGWMKFERASEELPAVRSDFQVRRVGPERAGDFAALAGPAFGLRPSSNAALAAIVEAPGHHAFMSFVGTRVAGTGVVFIDNGIAVLDWGATHPDFRRRGGQTAILAARVQFALEMGCKRIYTMTGEAVPGDPQHSYSNIQKAGFSEVYLRENWIPKH
ncbi:MAG: GNAT family N-acetyltransferase [Gammaproteobacteria bacterium]|nr:GNAT family N-acetyltransferase [Gammaproteobacteria bacterium]